MTQSTAVSTERREGAPRAPLKSGGALAAFVPQDSEGLLRLAEVLAKSGDMVPKQYQGRPAEITAAIMRGMEVGLAPMQALASIAVINGRASLWGDAMPALMQRAGHHVDVELEGEGDQMVAVATLTRGDTGRQVVRRFSMADARRAGLLGKQGPWTAYPQRMISMRARAWAIRDGAADALMGLSVAEETSDYGPDRARDVTPEAAPVRRGVAYEGTAGLVDEVLEGEVVEDDPGPAEPDDLALAGQAAAERGTAAYQAWWQGLAKGQRQSLADDHVRWKIRAADVDSVGAPAGLEGGAPREREPGEEG